MDYKPLAILILLACQGLAQATFDPLTVGVGARALAMGKASITLTEDGDILFSNPAGLGETDHFKFSTMSGNLLEDANYIVFGGIYPLGGQSAVGVGYAGTFVTGIDLRDAGGIFSRKANFGNHVGLIAYGKKLNENTSLGIDLKYLVADGTEIDDGDSREWNLDIGVLQKGVDWLSFALVGQNLIATSPRIKAGAQAHLLGRGFNSAIPAPWEVSAAIDTCFDTQPANTLTLHSGLELSPHPLLTLRIGSDTGNLTMGVGLRIMGLGFHYAYREFANFFSITFDERGWPPEEPSDVRLGCK